MGKTNRGKGKKKNDEDDFDSWNWEEKRQVRLAPVLQNLLRPQRIYQMLNWNVWLTAKKALACNEGIVYRRQKAL